MAEAETENTPILSCCGNTKMTSTIHVRGLRRSCDQLLN